jgi:GntR family transcriptional regulator
MILRVDTATSQSYFEQLAAQIRLAILHGELRLGERLPAAGDVAQSLDLNVHTVLHAYQLLRDEGLIELRRGRGAHVSYAGGADLTAVKQALTQFVEVARRAGLSPEASFALVREELLR